MQFISQSNLQPLYEQLGKCLKHFLGYRHYIDSHFMAKKQRRQIQRKINNLERGVKT